MRAANIMAAIAVALWAGMFLMGRDLAYGVYSHGAGVFPNSGQIDYYVLFPAIVMVFLAVAAWVLNIFRRWPAILMTISLGSILTLFPYLFFYTGGV